MEWKFKSIHVENEGKSVKWVAKVLLESNIATSFMHREGKLLKIESYLDSKSNQMPAMLLSRFKLL
jgi:hypothetical protein